LEQPDPTGKTLVTTATLLHHVLGHDPKRELDRYSGKNGDEVLRSFLCCHTYQIVLGNQLIFIPHGSHAVAAN
ncbi:hypothetical protein ACCS67_29245, partial [Rhizobium brockwellii]|uniref:hypothetical protein n=1 Tax=Rhizobium brockwellii TaxID=3019932 RepID=UPI003F9B1430